MDIVAIANEQGIKRRPAECPLPARVPLDVVGNWREILGRYETTAFASVFDLRDPNNSDIILRIAHFPQEHWLLFVEVILDDVSPSKTFSLIASEMIDALAPYPELQGFTYLNRNVESEMMPAEFAFYTRSTQRISFWQKLKNRLRKK